MFTDRYLKTNAIWNFSYTSRCLLWSMTFLLGPPEVTLLNSVFAPISAWKKDSPWCRFLAIHHESGNCQIYFSWELRNKSTVLHKKLMLIMNCSNFTLPKNMVIMHYAVWVQWVQCSEIYISNKAPNITLIVNLAYSNV